MSEEDANDIATIPAPPVPTTPDEHTPSAPPPNVWGVYPRLVKIEDTAGPVLAIVVVPEEPRVKALFDQLMMRHGTDSCRDTLATVRAGYFELGPGAKLREQEARLKETDDDAAALERTLAETRDQWRAAVATDSAEDVTKLEKAIEKHEANAKRLTARRDVLAQDVKRLRQDCATELYRLLLLKRDECEEVAELAVARAKAALAASVNETFGAWVTAELELAGCSVRGDELRLTASTEEKPPRSLARAVPGTLPVIEYERRPQKPPVEDAPALLFGNPPRAPERQLNGQRVAGDVVMLDGIRMVRLADGSLVDAADRVESVPPPPKPTWPPTR